MYIAILGRQATLGIAELERLYGAKATSWHGSGAALIDTNTFDFNRLGGSQKAGKVIITLRSRVWQDVSKRITQHYGSAWAGVDYKITLGISAYGFDAEVRDIQKTGIILKKKLKEKNVSLRLIPNAEPAHNTAVSHHNKLGLSSNKVELLIVRHRNGETIIAESVGAQNITALAARDQARPKTDAFVGMLPPKLAQMMVNMTGITQTDGLRLLDPFCGTGVVLQEAALMGYDVYGSDLAEKMVDYSIINLKWLVEKHHLPTNVTIEAGDAIEHRWNSPVDTVVAETYLGQPFSAPPASDKLTKVRRICDQIIGQFLDNLGQQIASGTTLCLAVPAWRDVSGNFTYLPLASSLGKHGYALQQLSTTDSSQLLYYRETQVVARQILILVKN